MSRQQTKRTTAVAALRESQRHWQTFFKTYQSTRLAGDACYALPRPLLICLEEAVPEFLEPDDLAFENEFAAAASFGCFHGQMLGQAEVLSPAEQALEQDAFQAVESIESMLDHHALESGANEYDIKQRKAVHRQSLQMATQKRSGYIGWLIRQQEYQRDVEHLRRRYSKLIRAQGGFPSRAIPLIASQLPESSETFAIEILDFYRRWALESLLTWDWPIPLRAELHGLPDGDSEAGSRDGVSLFLPWSTLQGGQMPTEELLRLIKATACPGHLREWVDASSKHAKRNADYFSVQTQLYRYFWLGLQARYPSRLRGHLQKIDAAFAKWLRKERDTITRHRIALTAALKPLVESQ